MTPPGTVHLSTSHPWRILQLTDFHSDVSEAANGRTRALVRTLVSRERPDLLAITGDIWCGDSRPALAAMWMQRDLDFLGSLGVPWCFTWGNHDYVDDLERNRRSIAGAANALLPEGDGRGNYRVELRAPGEDLPRWELYFLNSGPRWVMPPRNTMQKLYRAVRRKPPSPFTWLQEEVAGLRTVRPKMPPAILYFHIPLKRYQLAIDEGRAVGVAKERVLYWGDEADQGAAIVHKLGNIRACFCGHSHKNDFHFVESGVTFAYGRATGFGGYGGEELVKGATLLELEPDSDAFQFRTLEA